MPPRLKCGFSQEIEHYTVICFCTGNFIEYNDLLTSEKNIIRDIFRSYVKLHCNYDTKKEDR